MDTKLVGATTWTSDKIGEDQIGYLKDKRNGISC